MTFPRLLLPFLCLLVNATHDELILIPMHMYNSEVTNESCLLYPVIMDVFPTIDVQGRKWIRDTEWHSMAWLG